MLINWLKLKADLKKQLFMKQPISLEVIIFLTQYIKFQVYKFYTVLLRYRCGSRISKEGGGGGETLREPMA